MTTSNKAEDVYTKVCEQCQLNYVEKVRLKGLIKKYGDVFTVEYKSGEALQYFLGQRGPIGTYQENDPEMLIEFPKRPSGVNTSYSILYNKYFNFKQYCPDYYFGYVEFICIGNFKRQNWKLTSELRYGKVIIDKIIWDKSKKLFYPKFVILDKFNNVHDLYDYV